MSLSARREYLEVKRAEYQKANTRAEKGRILDEVCRTCGYHRKYAIRALIGHAGPSEPKLRRRRRPKKYLEALPVIQAVWEALDYACAERLHPVLLSTAEHLARHQEVVLTPTIREQLARISRATLARRLAELPSPKYRRQVCPRPKPGSLLRSEIPVARYEWDENRPGALEVDLVEHNGGSTTGHYAYTLSVVDVVSGWSRRRAFLGRSQKAVHEALATLLSEWPHRPWALHTDNGAEFLNNLLTRFVQSQGLDFHRSRPHQKNDNAHVEQRNRQFVREIVGYARYDSPEQVAWLNEVYALLDPYANLLLPTRKVVQKRRSGVRIRKVYDQARTPFDRLLALGALSSEKEAELRTWVEATNPLALHRRLEDLIARPPASDSTTPQAAD